MRRLATLAFLMLAATAPAAHADQTADIFQGFQAKSSDPIQVDASSLETYEDGGQRVSVFSGNVTVKRGNTTMTADTIKLFSPPGAVLPGAAPAATTGSAAGAPAGSTPAAGSFDRIEASGNISVKSGDEMVTGDAAVVDMKANTIVVTGNVVLSQGQNVISGSKLTVDLATGRARVDQTAGKQIRGVFTPAN